MCLLGAFAGCIASTSQASFTHLELSLYDSVTTPQGPKKVYRLYAHFSEGSDRLNSFGGTSTFPLVFESPCFGGNFYSPGGNTAPLQEAIDETPQVQWDTFVTIGVSIADQGSALPPLPPDATTVVGLPVIGGSLVTVPGGTVYAQSNAGTGTEQGRADYANDGDPQLRVMMGQFTVAPTDGVRIQIGFLKWYNAAGESTTVTDLEVSPGLEFGRCCTPSGCYYMSHMSCSLNGDVFIGCTPCSECPPAPCVGDVSPSGGDGEVNVQDMLAVINTWGPCPASCVTDLNADGAVNVTDLLAIINAWGTCP